jgi:peptidoglycan/LPS O-acetylase OafA/YrhL
MRSRPSYRPDIDGLRAISAGAVVLFHAQVPGFGGGFVGVDVFFVISGYLITQVLLASSNRPARHRLAEFYLRRCRRVLPALLVVLLIATPIAALVLTPQDLATYSKYLSSTSVLLTNVVAWTDHSGGWPALVHLWTISVEEQFYLVYPLVLLAACRTRAVQTTLLIGALCAVSFALSVWASYAAPGADFYLSPPRAWELLLGALLVLTRWRVRSGLATEFMAIAGLLVIAAAVCMYSSKTRYPGVYALPVCLAAAALLATGHRKTLVSRLLSVRALVFTGLISYSLYLWHAVILVLFWSWNGAPPDVLQTVLLLAAIFAVSVVNWRFVERPLRSGVWFKSNRHFLIAAAILNFALGAAGFLLWKVLSAFTK